MKQLSCIFTGFSSLKNTRKYAGFCGSIFSALACPVKTKGQNKDQTKTRKSGPGKPPWKRLSAPTYSQKRGSLEAFPATKTFCCYENRQHRICKARCKAYCLQTQPAGEDPRPPQESEKQFPLLYSYARVGNISPRRSPWQIPSHEREGGLFASLMPFARRAVLQPYPKLVGYESPKSQIMMLAKKRQGKSAPPKGKAHVPARTCTPHPGRRQF